jgi:hypothetical protein
MDLFTEVTSTHPHLLFQLKTSQLSTSFLNTFQFSLFPLHSSLFSFLPI